jgi:hypothetical protein
LKNIYEIHQKYLTSIGVVVVYFRHIFLRSLTMMKIISALLLAAMFIGCSESATTEAPAATEEAAPVAEEANMTTEAAPVAEEANMTEEAAAPAAEAK